jgi:hypothetical protein
LKEIKLIVLNEDYSFERDEYCWHLHSWYTGKDAATGKPKRHKKTTYHTNLHQVAQAIIERESKFAKDMKELIALYDFAITKLTAHIEGLDHE